MSLCTQKRKEKILILKTNLLRNYSKTSENHLSLNKTNKQEYYFNLTKNNLLFHGLGILLVYNISNVYYKTGLQTNLIQTTQVAN